MMPLLLAAALAVMTPQQVATADVAAAVEQAFPDHDANGDGTLSRAEFGAWLIALKAASDPRASTAAPATQDWVAGAWQEADADRNRAVSLTELTGFFSRAAGAQG